MRRLLVLAFFICTACGGTQQVNILLPAAYVSTGEYRKDPYPFGFEYVAYHTHDVGIGAAFYLDVMEDSDDSLIAIDINLYYKFPIEERILLYFAGGVSAYDTGVEAEDGYFIHEGRGFNLGSGFQYFLSPYFTVGVFVKYYHFPDSEDSEYAYPTDIIQIYNPSGFNLGFQFGITNF
jgi:hypothetical protein